MQGLVVSDFGKQFGVFKFLRIFVVDPHYLRGFDDGVGSDLDSAESARSIGRKEGISRACGKDHDATFFEVPFGATDDEGLADRFHLYRTLHAHIHACVFQRFSHSDCVYDGG